MVMKTATTRNHGDEDSNANEKGQHATKVMKKATRTKRTTRNQGVEDSNANEKDNTLPR